MTRVRPATAIYISVLLCLALGLTGGVHLSAPTVRTSDAIVMFMVASCMAVAWLFPIQFASRTKFYVDTAVATASVLLLPPAQAVAAVGIGTLLAHGVRHDSRDWAQALFNTAQSMIVALAAALLLALAGWRPIESSFSAPWPLLMLPVVALATYLLNIFLVATVVAFESTAPVIGSFWLALHEDLRIEALSHASLVTTGTLTALVAISEPWAVILLAVPIVATHTTLGRQARLRQEAERARKVSDIGLEEAQRLAHLGSWEWRPGTQQWVWSDEVYRILGMEPRSVAPNLQFLLGATHPDDRTRVEEMLIRALRNLIPFDIEHRLRLADGTERYVHQQGELQTADGGPPVFISMIQDVTERVRAEHAMREAAKVAQEADRAKTQLLTMASHELRTPLTSIQGYIEMVATGAAGEINDDQQELLGVAHRNALQLAELVNDLLVLARIEAGRLPMRIGPSNVSDAIASVVSTLAPLAANKGIRLDPMVDDASLFVSADPDRLNQVLLNLVGNAIKFTDQGGVTISASTRDHEVTITVADTGIGISADALPHVFEQFSQGSEAARRRGGAGLGLTIAKELVELQGGAIAVESGDGPGAIFTIRLPSSSPLTGPSGE